MKPMLSTKFQEKVHMIHEDELPYFFKTGFEKYLPDEFIEGEASTDQMVADFVAYRNAMEKATGKVEISTAKTFFGMPQGNKSGASKLRKLFGLGTTSSHDRTSNRKADKRALGKQSVQDALDVTETEVSGDTSEFTRPHSILAVK